MGERCIAAPIFRGRVRIEDLRHVAGDALGIQQRRARAIENKTTRFDSVDEFDRMAEKMEGAGDVDAAARELDLELDPLSEPAPGRDYVAERELREARAEDMLEELKRRMGVDE